jgi:hypothetical protein
MIVWGGETLYPYGNISSGARYDLATDSWTSTSMLGAPSAMSSPTGV